MQVIVGYYLEFALAALLALTFLFLQRTRNQKHISACCAITGVYADAAMALALAVELASTILLIKRESGLGSDDFGALTMQVVWVVALLVMLPIATFCWHDLKDKRFELRICVASLVYILFLITFICRMIATYSSGQVGSGNGAVITDAEEMQFEILCLSQTHQLSSSASITMEVFSIGGSIWVSGLVLGALIRECLDPNNVIMRRIKASLGPLRNQDGTLAIILIGLFVWSVPLFWVMMKLRDLQAELATDLGQSNGSQEWSFGQILAVVVFVPVLVEILNQYLERYNGEESESSMEDQPHGLGVKGP